MVLILHYYLYNENARSHKILAAAALAGIKVDQKMVVSPATEEFKANCSPLGGNPVLETPEGYIFESNAIMRYIARLDRRTDGHLYGKTLYENGMVDAWLDLCCSELDPIINHIYGFAIYGKELPEDFVSATDLVLTGIEKWLENRTFLVGERLTIADVCLAFTLQLFYRKSSKGHYFAEAHKNVFRLYNAVMHREETQAVLKSVGGGCGLLTKEEEDAANAAMAAKAKELAAAKEAAEAKKE